MVKLPIKIKHCKSRVSVGGGHTPIRKITISLYPYEESSTHKSNESLCHNILKLHKLPECNVKQEPQPNNLPAGKGRLKNKPSQPQNINKKKIPATIAGIIFIVQKICILSQRSKVNRH
jgi:hypothetical protein